MSAMADASFAVAGRIAKLIDSSSPLLSESRKSAGTTALRAVRFPLCLEGRGQVAQVAPFDMGEGLPVICVRHPFSLSLKGEGRVRVDGLPEVDLASARLARDFAVGSFLHFFCARRAKSAIANWERGRGRFVFEFACRGVFVVSRITMPRCHVAYLPSCLPDIDCRFAIFDCRITICAGMFGLRGRGPVAPSVEITSGALPKGLGIANKSWGFQAQVESCPQVCDGATRAIPPNRGALEDSLRGGLRRKKSAEGTLYGSTYLAVRSLTVAALFGGANSAKGGCIAFGGS